MMVRVCIVVFLNTEEQIGSAQKRIATYKEEFTNAKEIRQHRQGNATIVKKIVGWHQ